MTTKSQIPLPAEAPVMVLPGCVLFPGTMLPLRIFEPRYRAMLAWALERDRMFCVAMMKPDVVEAERVEQFHHTAGIGLVRACVTQSDGTSNLLVQGVARVQFIDFAQLEPFRIARLEPISSIAVSETAAATLVSKLRALCARLYGSDGDSTEKLAENLSKIGDPELLADFVASSFVRDPFHRQRLLEEHDVSKRLRSIANHLRQEFDLS